MDEHIGTANLSGSCLLRFADGRATLPDRPGWAESGPAPEIVNCPIQDGTGRTLNAVIQSTLCSALRKTRTAGLRNANEVAQRFALIGLEIDEALRIARKGTNRTI